MAGHDVPELDLPPLPAGCLHIWHTFIDLHNARASGGMGPCAISWGDVVNWQKVRDFMLNPWEIDVIMALDAVALKSLSDNKNGN